MARLPQVPYRVNEYSTRHPHEPDVPPVLDDEGRCLVCGVDVALDNLKQAMARLTHAYVAKLPRDGTETKEGA